MSTRATSSRERTVAAARPAGGPGPGPGPDAETAELVELVSPSPGLFRAAVHAGDLVRSGGALGELEILGRLVTVVAPDGVRGAVVAGGGAVIAGGGDARARLPVDFGAVLVTVDPRGLGAESAPAGARAADAGAAAAATAHGRAFRAPTSGRFYGRPTPGAAPFVSPGVELAPGATICLLEVMKTFNRVTYAGEPARVREVAVADGADVNAGDVLLLFE